MATIQHQEPVFYPLSTWVMGFVGCSDCGRLLGQKLFDGNDEANQLMIRETGFIVSHGVCPDCAAKIRDGYMALRACGLLSVVSSGS